MEKILALDISSLKKEKLIKDLNDSKGEEQFKSCCIPELNSEKKPSNIFVSLLDKLIEIHKNLEAPLDKKIEKQTEDILKSTFSEICKLLLEQHIVEFQVINLKLSNHQSSNRCDSRL